jgi:hypothetical protein
MKLRPGKEAELRQRRAEILMAGDGCGECLSEGEAIRAANEESVEEILDSDGKHLSETDPHLFVLDE